MIGARFRVYAIVAVAVLVAATAAFGLTPPPTSRGGSPVHADLSPGDTMPISTLGRAGDGSESWPPSLPPTFALNMVLSTAAPAGSAIVVYGAAGWDNGIGSMAPSDDGSTPYGVVQVATYREPLLAPAAPPAHWAKREMWFGLTTAPVTKVVIPVDLGPGKAYYLFGAAVAYANVSGPGANSALNATAQTNLITVTTTTADSWLAFYGFVMLETVTAACPTTGYTTLKKAGNQLTYAYLTANTTGGHPAPFGYVERCDTPYMGERAFDTNASLGGAGTAYTFSAIQYSATNNVFYFTVELQPSIVPRPRPPPGGEPPPPPQPCPYPWSCIVNMTQVVQVVQNQVCNLWFLIFLALTLAVGSWVVRAARHGPGPGGTKKP